MLFNDKTQEIFKGIYEMEKHEHARIWKRQNPFFCQIRKMSEYFKTGKCQNPSNSEHVRILQNWKSQNLKMSEFFRTGKCQNGIASKYSFIVRCQKLNLSELSKTRKCHNLKMSQFSKTEKHQNLKMSESFKTEKG